MMIKTSDMDKNFFKIINVSRIFDVEMLSAMSFTSSHPSYNWILSVVFYVVYYYIKDNSVDVGIDHLVNHLSK